jgi:hypothetical protein
VGAWVGGFGRVLDAWKGSWAHFDI